MDAAAAASPKLSCHHHKMDRGQARPGGEKEERNFLQWQMWEKSGASEAKKQVSEGKKSASERLLDARAKAGLVLAMLDVEVGGGGGGALSQVGLASKLTKFPPENGM